MLANLIAYIENAREKKVADEDIKSTLVAAGWPEDQVIQAISQKASSDGLLPPPPPPPIPHIGMWTGFVYILFFIALYVLMTSIAGILHQWVDLSVPDTKDTSNSFGQSYNRYLMQGFIAAVIVSYPIFFTLALVLKKQLSKNIAVRNLRSRKLLIYITLIGTFLIMLCHVIATIYSFLGGTLTSNALSHLGVTFLIAGSIFGYFINEVKNDRKNNE